MTPPLTLWLVFGDAGRPGNGALRLLDRLCDDPRYDIARCFTAPPPRDRTSAPIRAQLGLESALPLPGPYDSTHWPDVRDRIEHLGSPITGACDVVVDFTHAPEVAGFAAQARHGLWRLDAFAPGGGIAAALSGAPATPVQLTRLPAPDAPPRLIAAALYDTKPLAGRNRAYIREKSVQLIERELARLHRDGAPADAGPPDIPAVPRATALAGYGARTLADIAGRLNRRVAARTGRTPRRFALRSGPGTPEDFNPSQAREIPMPDNHFWADPFLIPYQGQTFCLFEDYDYATGLGQIGAGILTDTSLTYIGPAHTAAHHLSYPFVFAHDGEIYMMPETQAARRLEIWRATRFPTQWSLHATALKGQRLADSVLLNDAGTWWLFTNICRDGFGDFCGELHLFRVDGPDLTRIEPHRLNPIVIGADTARGAGRIHRVGRRLLRFSQDNTGGVYGYGLNAMAIDRLDLDDYAEHRVRHVTPDFSPGLIGCHHFDSASGRFIIDVRRVMREFG